LKVVLLISLSPGDCVHIIVRLPPKGVS
jgi:hypothetical protein